MARAALVLFTPDDLAMLRPEFQKEHDPEFEKRLVGQARPNVLVEAGAAMALFGQQTVVVSLGTVRELTDLGGFHVLRLSNRGATRQGLANRLKTAGCAVDLSSDDWHEAGDFTPTPVAPPDGGRDGHGWVAV